MPNTFTPVFTGKQFPDPLDVYVNGVGEYAYLQIMVPQAKVFVQEGHQISQSPWQMLPRFGEKAERGTFYMAAFLPFSKEGGLMDSRIPSMNTISAPIFLGPFELGINGPAILLKDDARAGDEDQDTA